MGMGYEMSRMLGERPKPNNSKPGYIDGKKSNPHASPKKDLNSWYKDHGKGKRLEDNEEYDEDRIQKGETKDIW